MSDNYSYPMDLEWTQEELVKVMNMWSVVEDVYEQGVPAQDIMNVYKSFKEVVKSIGEERSLGKEFETLSGYSLYQVMQAVKRTPERRIRL